MYNKCVLKFFEFLFTMKFLPKILFLILLLGLSISVNAQYGKITGDLRLDKADELYKTGYYDDAKSIYSSILADNVYEVGSKEWMIAKVGLGSSLLDLGDKKNGADNIFDADSLKSEKLEKELLAYLYKQRAWANGARGLYNNREQDYKDALQIAIESGDEFRIAQLKISNAVILRRKNLDQALKYAKEAATYFNEQRDYFHLLLAYSNLFYVYNDLGAYEIAEKVLIRAIEVNEELKNIDLMPNWYWRGSTFYSDIGKLDQALVFYKKNLEYVDENTSNTQIAALYNNIGLAYTYLNDYKSSLEYYERSLEYRRKQGMKPAPVNISNIAIVYKNLGELETAESLFKEALEGFKAKGDTSFIASTYEFLALIKLDTKELELAEQYGLNALDYATKLYHEKDRNSAWRTLAKIYNEKGEYNRSLDLVRKAYSEDSKEIDFRFLGTLIELSKGYRAVQSDSAFYYADKALGYIEDLRSNIYGDYLQAQLFRSFANFYTMVAYWNLEDGNKEKAFTLVERGKSRALLDQLSLNTPISEVLNEEEAIKIFEKSKRIDYLYRQLDLKTDESEKKEIRSDLLDEEFQHRALLNEAKVKYPQLNALQNPEIANLEEIQSKLDNNSAILEFATTGDKLISFWITKTSIKANVQILSDNSSEVLLKEVQAFREAIQNKETKPELYLKNKNLYTWLLAPIMDSASNVSEIIIVPDVSISYLPFEALIDEDEKFLIEKVNVKYLPSLSLLNYIKEPHRKVEKDILAIAGAGFEGNSSTNNARSQTSFASLPATLMEVDSISKKFENFTVLKNEEVTESELKSIELSQYKYIHFATHGVVNHDNPNQSGLVLSQRYETESIFGEDGLLNSSEIGFLKLNADLVVLSACNSGFGNNIKGEGLMGLQRSFLKAGASSVLVSLWSVFDRSTAMLMSDFYENMGRLEEEEMGLWNKTLQYFNQYEAPLFGYKEEALREAKLSMIKHPYYNHPVYWAPFVLIGK